jgi:hypothetical protein
LRRRPLSTIADRYHTEICLLGIRLERPAAKSGRDSPLASREDWHDDNRQSRNDYAWCCFLRLLP